MSIESLTPSNHLILCHPLFLPPSIFPTIRVSSNESAFHIRWPKYWSFSFSIIFRRSLSMYVVRKVSWLWGWEICGLAGLPILLLFLACFCASGREPACQCIRCERCEFDPWVGKISWRMAQQSTSIFLPGESLGWWLVDYISVCVHTQLL